MPLDPSVLSTQSDEPRGKRPLDDLLKGEGAEHLKPVIEAIYSQESGSGKNSKTSVDGARGPMQIMPGTFKQLARDGESIDNPDDNMRVSIRLIKALGDKFSNDPARIAAAYFSGEGNVNPTGDQILRKDKADGNGKRVSSYVQDVLNRIVPSAQAEADVSQLSIFKDNGPDDKLAALSIFKEQPAAPAPATSPEAKGGSLVEEVKKAVGWREGEKFTRPEGVTDATFSAGVADVPPDGPVVRGSVLDGSPVPDASRPTGETGGVPLRAERLQQFRTIARDQPSVAKKMAAREDWAGQAMRAILAEQGVQVGRIQQGDNLIAPNRRDMADRATLARQAELVPGGEDNAKIAYNQKGDIGKNMAHVTQGVAQGVLDIRDGVIGAGQAALRLVGATGAADVLQQHQEELKAQAANLDLPSTAQYGAKTVQAVTRSITMNVPGLLTGAEAPALAAMGIQSFGQEFGTGRAAGMTDAEAAVRAGIYGAAEILGEKFGLGDTLKGLKAAANGVPTSEVVGFFGRALAKEIPGEQLTSAIEFGADKYLPQGLHPQATFDDYLRVVGDTLVQTVLQSGLMMGGGAAASKAVQAIDQQFPQAALARALREQVEGGQFDPNAIDRVARLQLDPNTNGNTEVLPEARGFAKAPAGAPEPQQQPAAVTPLGNDPLQGAPVTNPIASELASLEGEPAPSGQPQAEPTLAGKPVSQHTPTSLSFLMNAHPDQVVREQAAQALQQQQQAANEYSVVTQTERGPVESKIDSALKGQISDATVHTLATETDSGRFSLLTPASAGSFSGGVGGVATSAESFAQLINAISGRNVIVAQGVPFRGVVADGRNIILNQQQGAEGLKAVAFHEVRHTLADDHPDLSAFWRDAVQQHLDTSDGALLNFMAHAYQDAAFAPERIAAMRAKGRSDSQILNAILAKHAAAQSYEDQGRGSRRDWVLEEMEADALGDAANRDGVIHKALDYMAKVDIGLVKQFAQFVKGVLQRMGKGFGSEGYIKGSTEEEIRARLEALDRAAAEVLGRYASRTQNQKRMQSATPAELLLIKKSHPDAIVRDMAAAELKKRETEAAYTQREEQKAGEKENFKQANAQARLEQAEAEAKAAGTDDGTPTALAQALAGAKKDIQALRRQLATEMRKAAATARGKAQVRADQLEDNEMGRFSPKRDAAPQEIEEGKTIEQAEPLSAKQWKDVREIALGKLSDEDRTRALGAEREYLALSEEANRDSEAYKETARKAIASTPAPVLSTVPVLQGKKNYTIKGTGKNNKTRVFDVARVLRKGVLSKAGDIMTTEGRERVARALVHEALYSLSMDGHAVGWYDRKVKEALAVTALAHPEILTDGAANFHFRVIAAVTSNGQAVRDNFILANDIYKIWKSEGVLPTQFEGGGTRAPAMKAAFAKLNSLVSELGWETTEKELMTLRSVRDIEKSFDLKISGELKDAMVPTAVGMGGPKIGNFFANLSGYFDSPTMDLWFMRTIGRMTGGLIQTKKGLVTHLDTMLGLLPASGSVHGISVATIRKEVAAYKGLTEEEQLDPEVTIRVLKKTEAYARAQYARFAAEDASGKTFTQKTPENENARSLKMNLSALVEAPGNGKERDALRQVVQRALVLLERTGIKVTAADLQAVLWYYEKNLYAKLGDISESAKPWDYASAARFGVGRQLGLVDVGSSSRAGQVRGGEPGSPEDGAGRLHGQVQAAGQGQPEQVVRKSPVRIAFEVAPDPNNAELTARWNALSEAAKAQISYDLARSTTAAVLAHYEGEGVKGEIHTQVGGYLDNTNPSFSLWMGEDTPMAKVQEITNILGYALDQDSMVIGSPKMFKDGSEMGMVVIRGVSDTNAKKVYDELRTAIRAEDGSALINGHTTAENAMSILVDLGTQVQIAQRVAEHLGDRHDVYDSTTFVQWPERGENEYGLSGKQEDNGSGPEPSLRKYAHQLREEAAAELERRIAGRFSPGRSDAARDERTGGGNAETARELASYGRPAPGAVSAVGRHYSAEQRERLDGRYYGTGASGKEGPRVRAASDPRIKERIYFYANRGNGITPEQGVGSHAHDIRLDNLYDANADTWVQKKVDPALRNDDALWLNAFESAVIDSGFDGYLNDFGTQRAAVLLGRHNVQPTYVGQNPAEAPGAAQAKTPEAPAPKNTDADKVEQSRVLPAGQMSGADWKRMLPAVVPGIDASMLDDAKTYYKSDVVQAMRGGARLSPSRAQTETPEFKKWFGKESNLRNEDGSPMVLYHGTNKDFAVFKASKTGVTGAGVYLGIDPGTGDSYAGDEAGANVMPVYARGRYIGLDAWSQYVQKEGSWAKARAKAEADGVAGIIDVKIENAVNVFDPANIKSAIGNNGQFDGANPDIRFSPARQGDLFAKDFANKRTTVRRELVVSSKGAKEKVTFGNVASDGRQIAPTKQALENFWDWYGQGPVDDKNRPVLLYHSTNGDVSAFETGRETVNNYGLLGDVTTTRAGIFASPDQSFSQEYLRGGAGQNVMPIYMAIQNPIDMREGINGEDLNAIVAASDGELTHRDFYYLQPNKHWELFDDEFGEKFVRAAKAAGFDGAVMVEDSPSGKTDGGTTYVAFDGNQIKSATGNLGTFDPSNPDIRFSPARQPIFYSQLARQIEQAPDRIFTTAPQVKLWLNGNAAKLGIKKDEIQWSGINEWLDMITERAKPPKAEPGLIDLDWEMGTVKLPSNKVTKQQVLDYLDQGGVKVEEVEKAQEGYSEEEPSLPKGSGLSTDEDERGNWGVLDRNGRVIGRGRSEEDAIADAYSAYPDYWEQSGSTKYSDYTLPGGKNYKELLLTLPEKEPRNLNDIAKEMFGKRFSELEDDDANAVTRAEREQKKAENYRSNHWEEKNILAHIRFNERTDAEGNRVLFIEEVQSDWGQAGKKQGFDTGERPAKAAFDAFIAKLRSDYEADIRSEFGAEVKDPARLERVIAPHLANPDHTKASYLERKSEYNALRRAYEDEQMDTRPKPGPFVTDTKAWVALALKRMMRYAADNGFQKIAFVNGEQSADRYDLSKQITTLYAGMATDGKYLIGADGKSGRDIIDQKVTKEELPGVVGKELAEKIIQDVTDEDTNAEYTGLDLKVGGEGMKTFYDKIVPQVASDLLKKMGGKLETVQLKGKGRLQQPGFAVPAAASEPMPLFSWARRFSDEEGKAATALMTYLAEDKAMFQVPISQAETLPEIVKEIDPAASIKDVSKWFDDGRTVWRLTLPKVGNRAADAYITERDGKVWINAASLEEGSDGNRIYAMVGNYAYNTGKVFIGDPEGITTAGMRRRAENMMSLALKFGTTDFIEPHEKMLKLLGMTWEKGNEQKNLQSLLNTTYNTNVSLTNGEIADVTFNFDDGKFYKNGSVFDDAAFARLAAGVRGAGGLNAAGAPGTRSLRVAALVNTVLSRANSAERGALLESVRAFRSKEVRLADSNNGGVEGPLHSLRYSRIRDAVDSTIRKLDAAVDGLSNLPDQFDYLNDRYLALGKIARVDEIAAEIRKSFEGVPQADKQAVYAYLTTRGASPTMIGHDGARAMAQRIKQTINYVGDALVSRGLLDPAVRAKYKDQYLPRLYLKHAMSDMDWKMIGAGKKPSDMGYLKHRKDIPVEVRELVLGEIKDPAYLSASAIGRAMRDVALLDWLGRISQNGNWVYPDVFVNYRGQRVTAFWLKAEAARINNQIPHYTPANQTRAKLLVDNMNQLADQALANLPQVNGQNRVVVDHVKYRQIPDTIRYGLLRGMLVREEIYDDVMGASQIINAEPTWFEDWFGFGGKGTRLTQWWKFSKVALNPPGQVRNFLSNMVMLQLSGVGLHKLPVRLVQAVEEIASDGPHWKVAKKYGVTESTFTAQELYRIKRDLIALEAQSGGMNPLTWLRVAAAHVLDKVSNLYQFSEALGKTIKIIDEMEKGKTEAEAAIEAQKWLFDYSLVPQSVRIARNAPVGLPFLTYQVKVLPRLLEVAAKHPWRFLPWVGLFYGMQSYVASLFGVDEDELKKLKKSLPQWLQDRSHTVFLPTRDADGRVQVADVGYFFPWTFYTQFGMHMAGGEFKKALVDDLGGQFSAPILGAAQALGANYNTFTHKPIYNEDDPASYKAAAIANYAWDLMAPPFISSHGFASPMGLADKQYGGKMVQAVTGTTNKFGDPKATEAQAIAGLMGFNFYGMDPEHTRATNMQLMARKVQNVETTLKQRMMDRGLTAEQRAKYIADYQAKMVELAEEAKKYAEESEVPAQLRAR